MIKVVIADDEEKICQLIEALIEWEKLDMKICAIAHNGVEALEIIKRVKPDIVITDIRMPGCDGLEMIEKTIKIVPDIQFIIISGFRHFEYAQSAISYGVRNYLLKPIKKDELWEALSRLHKNYMLQREQLSNEEQSKLSMKKDINHLRAMFFTDIIFKRLEIDDVHVLNEKYHYNFKEGCFQIVLIKPDGVGLTSAEDEFYMHDKLLNLVEQRLKNYCFDMEVVFENQLCIVFLNYSKENAKNFRKLFKSLLNELLLQKEILENLKVTIGLGLVQDNIKFLYESKKTALWAIEQRIVLGVNRVIEGEKISSNALAESDMFYEFNKSFSEAFDRLDEMAVRETFQNLKSGMEKRKDITGHAIVQMAKEAINLYLFCMRKNRFPLEKSETFFDDYCDSLNKYSSLEEIIDFTSKTILESFRKTIEEKRKEDNKPVREAKQYIKQHYSETLSLEFLSEKSGYNTAYFSALFKKEAGKTFQEYLIETRIEKAKELLKETNRSVAVICSEVGYSDVKYFTKTFSKYTNLKPNEYRKIYS